MNGQWQRTFSNVGNYVLETDELTEPSKAARVLRVTAPLTLRTVLL